MSTFEIGQRVIVTGVTPYGETEGCEGVIVKHGLFHDWLVNVTFPDGSHDELGYDSAELAPQDAPTDAGAYSYNAGAIQWANGYEAINQLTKAAAEHEGDSRFMHETLDAIHGIAAQEAENARSVGMDTPEHMLSLINAMNQKYTEAQASAAAKDARIRALEAALAWYADGENYVDKDLHDYIDISPIADDLGSKAREALAAQPTTDAGDGDAAAELADVVDHLATESVMLAMEIAEALSIDRHTFLDADGPDAMVEAIATLRAQVDTLTAEINNVHFLLGEVWGNLPLKADTAYDLIRDYYYNRK